MAINFYQNTNFLHPSLIGCLKVILTEVGGGDPANPRLSRQYFTAVLGWRDSDTREQQGGLGAAAGLGVMARSHATVATLPPAGLQYCATVCLTKLNTGAGFVRS